MTRRRVIVGIATAMIVLVVSMLWFVNTESLEFPFQDEPLRLAAGETAEVEIDIPCQPTNRIVYRPSFFGRWQETHSNGEADVRRWWDLGRRSYATPMVCVPGPMIVRVPDDVTADRIAVCGLGTGNCVEILVEQAD